MLRKIPEITSELIHYLFSKAHKFENYLIITINDTIIIIIIIITPETRKYWVDVQRGIVLSHGERDPL